MSTALQIISLITGGAAVIALFVKIFLSMACIREGLKCLLRQQMLETYYNCKQEKKIRQYRSENFALSYKAYKALGGNSFIDHIKAEVDDYEVVT